MAGIYETGENGRRPPESMYGTLKMWEYLQRQGIPVAKCTVERLKNENGWKGRTRGRRVRTTIPDPAATRAPDLVNRQFRVERPGELLSRASEEVISMPVTEDQVAALRALLVDDIDLHKRLFSQLDRSEARKGYTALVTAAFVTAVERRFGKNYQPQDVVTFVADLRSRSDRLARDLDPEVAERVIYTVLSDATVQDLPKDAVTRAKLLVLAGVIADERPSSEGLDDFLTSARKLADQLMT